MREVGYVHFAEYTTFLILTDGEKIYGQFPETDTIIEFDSPRQVYSACCGFAEQHFEIDKECLYWENV